jgi:hypothetical protein
MKDIRPGEVCSSSPFSVPWTSFCRRQRLPSRSKSTRIKVTSIRLSNGRIRSSRQYALKFEHTRRRPLFGPPVILAKHHPGDIFFQSATLRILARHGSPIDNKVCPSSTDREISDPQTQPWVDFLSRASGQLDGPVAQNTK